MRAREEVFGLGSIRVTATGWANWLIYVCAKKGVRAKRKEGGLARVQLHVY
jgi:hypothetical protein